MKVLRDFVTDKDITDVKGWVIPKGTKLYVIKESKIDNPMTKEIELWLVVRVDNGTGDINLMTEAAYKEAV